MAVLSLGGTKSTGWLISTASMILSTTYSGSKIGSSSGNLMIHEGQTQTEQKCKNNGINQRKFGEYKNLSSTETWLCYARENLMSARNYSQFECDNAKAVLTLPGG